MSRPLVLIVDDDASVRKTLDLLLGDLYETVSVGDAFEALEVVKSMAIDLVLLDINMPRMDGFKAMTALLEYDPEIGIIIISATDSAEQAVVALKMGAYDYITKPFEHDDLISTLKRYIDKKQLKRKVEFLSEELHGKVPYGEIISKSPKMKEVFDLINKVSFASSNVLLTGESGTGKELAARAIHNAGDRKDKPFVAVNCGAVPRELMESELFGHERGAFTGAYARKIGKFEYADGGTLFLDEISTLEMALQVKLLRVLQERSFERVGGNATIKVDIRVISATNVDLFEAIRRATFREDLFYRLNVVPIKLPPLRERPEDIALLVDHFIHQHNANNLKKIQGLTEEALEVLKDYPWQGNVRELENMIERLVVLATDGSQIGYNDLPVELFFVKGNISVTKNPMESLDFKSACKAFEKRYLINVLTRTGWNRTEASKILNIHRNTLFVKMKEFGLTDQDSIN